MCIRTGAYTAIAFQKTVMISSCFTGRVADSSLSGSMTNQGRILRN